MLSEFRYCLRLLRRSWWFSAAAVATLSLGIGATTAIFAVFDRVVMNPLPISDPDRVVTLHREEGQSLSRGFTYPAFVRLAAGADRIFGSVAASGRSGFKVRIGDETRLASAAFVSDGYLEQLGVRLSRGRSFAPDEYAAAAPLVTVITDAFWRARMAADPHAVGREIRVGDTTATVIGILPRGFRGLEIASPVDLFVPLLSATTVLPEGNYFSDRLVRFENRGYSPQAWLNITGRLRPGVSVAQAEAYAPALNIDTVPNPAATPFRFVPASAAALSLRTGADTKRFATLLVAVVCLVLLLGCANLTGLILARNEQRRREVAVRLALGASRIGVVRLFLVEMLVLSILGGLGSTAVALWMLHAMSDFVLPGGIEVAELQLGLTARVLLVTTVAALFAALVTGVLPALASSRPDVVDGLKSRPDAAVAGRGMAGGLLVAGQIAISLVLVLGAVLFLRSLRTALGTDVGAEIGDIAYAQVSLWGAGYDKRRLETFNRDLLARLKQVPGVEGASYGGVPLVGFPGSTPAFKIDGVERRLRQTLIFQAGPEYLATLGIQIVAGSGFDPAHDRAGGATVVVNESFARQAWPGGNPLGRRLFIQPQGPDLEVVGVAPDGKYGDLREAGRLAIYVPWRLQTHVGSSETIVVRTTGDTRAAAAAIQREIRRLDPTLAIIEAGTLDERVAQLAMTQRIGVTLLGWFGVVAIALAVLGIYGLVAHAVATRTTEIGIRLALGAVRSHVVRLMLTRVLIPVSAGIVAGVVGAYSLSRFAGSFLFGVEPHDPLSYVLAVCVLLLVVAVASYIPARRAARVDPMVALRTS